MPSTCTALEFPSRDGTQPYPCVAVVNGELDGRVKREHLCEEFTVRADRGARPPERRGYKLSGVELQGPADRAAISASQGETASSILVTRSRLASVC